MNRRFICEVAAALGLCLALGLANPCLAVEPAHSAEPSSPASKTCGRRLNVTAGASNSPFCTRPGSGEGFRDCPNCPEMTVAPPGSFMMGSSGTEPDPFTGLAPLHRVTIANPVAISKFAVTFAEWDACVSDGGCGGYTPSSEGWGRGDRPVINVSWNDAKAYAAWVSGKTGKPYRLLSEAEFEYAARAGTSTLFWWGDSISPAQANYDGAYSYAGSPKGPYRRQTLPVKSFEPNPWGFYQVHGNVATWTEDCWVDNYNGAPLDGSARTTGNCKYRVTRGGSWYDYPQTLRVAVRIIVEPRLRMNYLGFRVARDLCGAVPHPRSVLKEPGAGNRC